MDIVLIEFDSDLKNNIWKTMHSLKIQKFNLLILAAIRLKFWPKGQTWTSESEGRTLLDRRRLRWETACGMKRKQKVGGTEDKARGRFEGRGRSA